MINDKSILYNAKLKELKNNLKEISKIKIKIFDFSSEIDSIEKEVETKIRESYSSFYTNETSSFLNESLNKIYTDAIKKIEKINNYISSEYSSYYSIYSKCLELENKLNDSDINELIIDANILLKKLKETSSVDFNEEKELVDMVYNLVYKIIKKEIIVNNTSQLLRDVKMDEIDSIFIAELIKKDVEQVKDNKHITQIINNLNSKNFSSSKYIDEKLILYIIFDNDKDLISSLKDTISNKLDEYQETSKKINDNDSKINYCESEIVELKDKIKELNIKKLIGITKLSLCVGIATLTTVGIIKISKKDATDTYYMTTTETYDSFSKETSIEESYELGDNMKVFITEYTPWKKVQLSNKYKRNVTTYKVANNEVNKFENIEDYLKIDASNLEKDTSETEEIELLLDKAVYDENKYEVKRIKKDLDDFIQKLHKERFSTNLIFFGLISLFFYFLSFSVIWNNKNLRYYFDDSDYGKSRLKDVKKMLLELKRDKKSLNDVLKSITKEIEVEYEELPLVLQEDKDLKEKVLKLENKK